MPRRIGNNAQRRTVGANTTNHIGDDIRRTQTMGVPPTLQRAVVVDVITDPDLLSNEDLDALASTVGNAELIDIMPINSIVARIVSNNSGGDVNPNLVLFPFFSSHVMLPVQPGETVYVVFEDYRETGAALGYWFTRIHAQGTVEDVNYTHLDRRFDASMNPQNYSTEERLRTSRDGSRFTGPGFPNGGNTEESRTLESDQLTNTNKDPYEQIKEQSRTYKLSTIEPVPRWRKRPSELVFQGSNNALVYLGEDRSGAVDNESDAKGQAGTVGIIVGRGRDTTYGTETEDEVPKGTAPRVVKNTRNEYETDKAPYRRGFQRKTNPNEGNPDVINDAAMVLTTMQAQIDERFGLSLNPNNSLKLPNVSGTGTFNRSHVVGKADHIRLIARKNEEKGVAGSVLLVREGEPDEDLGYFFIDENGQIQIEAVKIYLGRSIDESEPYIKWTEFKKAIEKLQSQIDTIATACTTAIGNLGAPIPSLTPVQGQISTDKIATAQAVEDAKSEKIFGE